MVAARAARGLSEADLDGLRRSLAGGRKPKVVFTPAAGQLAGQAGQVVELADPTLSDEWVMVRFGRDTLPFSPADLEIPAKPARSTSARPARGGAARGVQVDAAAAAPPPVRAAQPRRDQAGADAPPDDPPASDRAKPASARPAQVDAPAADAPARPATVGNPRPARAGAATSAAVQPVGPPADAAAAEAPADAPAKPATTASARPAPRRAARSRAPAALAITLSYGDGRWTVGAQQGGRVLAKPADIRASEALRVVALLDVPAVQEAVEQIVAAARADAEREADRLRAELAAVEARLADLPGGAPS